MFENSFSKVGKKAAKRRVVSGFALLIAVAVVAACLFSAGVKAADAGTCEVCADVDNVFTIDRVELKETNVITLKGHDSHGLRYLSISCEMLDETPPAVDIVGLPPDWTNETQTVSIKCDDEDSGCWEKGFFFDRYGTYIGPGGMKCEDISFDSYEITTSYTLSQHGWLCAAAIDYSGNVGYSKVYEVLISGEPPEPPDVWTGDVGADYVVLEWNPVKDTTFDHYEVHFSQNWDFVPGYDTLYLSDKEQYGDGGGKKTLTVEGLNASTQYYFRVAVVDIFGRMSYNEYPVSATTTKCNDGEKRKCGYSDKGACVLGDETCVDGMWSGECVGAVYPEDETCNGIDDDCDGLVDEDDYLEYFSNPEWPGGVTPMSRGCPSGSAKGECIPGLQYCVGGEWETDEQGNPVCRGGTLPQPEVCDGLDNDCNGVVDDVNGGSSVEETQCACYAKTNFPGDLMETCNGIDDNCDGVVDNVFGGESVEETQCACYNNLHEPGELEETCNGIDDDCNAGLFANPFRGIDDPWQEGGSMVNESNYLGRPCGFGECLGGEYECSPDGSKTICSTIGGSEDMRKEEVCDGIDNDCDLSVDEGCECVVGDVRSCGFDEGICSPGYQECVQEDGVSFWGPCTGGTLPQPEICGDGLDNDCNGVVDDIDWCGCYNGSLPSVEVCNGIDDDCDGVIDNMQGAESPEDSMCMCFGGKIKKGEKSELCNGIDDDCDGEIDEDWRQGGEKVTEYDYLGLSCGYGNSRCSGGEYVCSKDGTKTVCSTMSKEGMGESDDMRVNETCNGIDDDCDGVIDNIQGMLSLEETRCGCFNGSAPLAAEFCNKIDDDCDGDVDEDVVCMCMEGETKPCGSNIGICTLGQRTCVNGEWGECEGGTGPRDEVCNRKDDNCDGVVDNVGDGYSVEETRCACYNNGMPSVEVCNGIDDDCNGKIDDDIDCSCEEGQEMPCGSNVGECTPGVKKCVNGKWGPCTGGTLPQPEVCDGLDNDCNGVVDDVNMGNSISSTRCACYNRFASPGMQSEVCNGIDDDCDGKIDEGCITSAPAHCGNGRQDGDEEGVDCGGSCPEPCLVMPTLNTWLLVFAVLVAVIAIFGIFFTSFWKKETKSLFERAGAAAVFIPALLVSLSVILPAVSSSTLVSFEKTWSCSNNNGFTSAPEMTYCYKEGCMGEPQLLMWHLDRSGESKSQYDFEFKATPGNYACTISVVTNHFSFQCGSAPYGPQPDEKTDVFLNGEKIGTTEDPYCNSNSECGSGGVCPEGQILCGKDCCLRNQCCPQVGANCQDPNYCYCGENEKVLAEAYTRDAVTEKGNAYCAYAKFTSRGGNLIMYTTAVPHGAKLAIATEKCKEDTTKKIGIGPKKDNIKCGPWEPKRKGASKTCENMPTGTLYAVVWHDNEDDGPTEIVVCQKLDSGS